MADKSISTTFRDRIRLFSSRFDRLLNNLIIILFVGLCCFQILDLHSTLTASPDKIEQNQLITVLCRFVNFNLAVGLIKFFDAALLAGLFFGWRRTNGANNREFAFCLGILVVAYGIVIMNNYYA
jgi:hypothetical protein